MKWSVRLQVVEWEFMSHRRPLEQRVLPVPGDPHAPTRGPHAPRGPHLLGGRSREVIHVTLLLFSSQEV